MDEAHTNGRLASRWPSVGITSILTASACIFLGFRVVLALGGEDVDKYESPLMLSVGRQLVTGPWELYGPFGGSNPLVLIHAPLYYRAAALVAWPMARAGLHPVEAARRAGRLISAMGLMATAMAAYRLGRLGGLPRRAGWWSALLVAASPVLAGQPFAVRPDMAGVALQSWGVVLVLEGLNGGGRRLGVASTLFGLSACVKQHLVGAWAVSVVLAWLRGRAGGSVTRVVLPGVAVAAAIYGAEWVVTGGRIWDAAFVAAANVGRVHPGDWLHVGTVVAAMAGQGAGLAALAVAAHGRGPGWIGRMGPRRGLDARRTDRRTDGRAARDPRPVDHRALAGRRPGRADHRPGRLRGAGMAAGWSRPHRRRARALSGGRAGHPGRPLPVLERRLDQLRDPGHRVRRGADGPIARTRGGRIARLAAGDPDRSPPSPCWPRH